jgi:dUTP pyrophosphatase
MAQQQQQEEEELFVELLTEAARAPTRGSERAAGYDLYSAVDVKIPKGGKALVSTGIAIAVPPGHYGRIAPRSGLAVKKFIDVGAGVVDEDYRGNVGVLLFNFDREEDYEVKVGDRIAQLVLEKISTPPVRVVASLDETARGEGGFGSTGN